MTSAGLWLVVALILIIETITWGPPVLGRKGAFSRGAGRYKWFGLSSGKGVGFWHLARLVMSASLPVEQWSDTGNPVAPEAGRHASTADHPRRRDYSTRFTGLFSRTLRRFHNG